MKITIEFRKPSKRMIWNLKRLDRWLDRHLPPLLTILSGALVAGGFIALLGVVGSIEYGDAVTGWHIRLLISSFGCMAAGAGLAMYIGGGSDYGED